MFEKNTLTSRRLISCMIKDVIIHEIEEGADANIAVKTFGAVDIVAYIVYP